METLIVILIIGISVYYCARSFIRKYKGQSQCDSGCSVCSSAETCEAPDQKESYQK